MSHDHSHHSDESEGATMPMSQKLAKLLDHWASHNRDHVESYQSWADRARTEGFSSVAEQLDEAARRTAAVTACFETARTVLGPDPTAD